MAASKLAEKVRYEKHGRRQWLRRAYGITPKKYDELLEQQDGRCAICGVENCSTGRRFAVDHKPETDEIRGLFCYTCNTKLGWYERRRCAVDNYLGRIF